MFSTLPTPAHPHTFSNTHAPQVSSPLSSSPLRSSPLSPHDANIFSRPPYNPEMSPTPSPKSQLPTPPSARGDTQSFSKRTVKVNPLIHARNNGRETRRKLFLKKVREGSEDKRWANRGGEEEMMRAIWVQEERKRIEMREREAKLAAGQPLEEEEIGIPMSSNDQDMVDEVLQAENAELEAMLAMMEAPGLNHHDQEHADTSYGSDDEEYDHLFMGVIQMENSQPSQSQNQDRKEQDDHEMMDMS